MREREVAFTPEAIRDLEAIESYITDNASAQIAQRVTNGIISACEGLRDFPLQGRCRDDIRPGVRTLSYKKRAVIAYTVETDAVTVLGVFYAGRNYPGASEIKSGDQQPPE